VVCGIPDYFCSVFLHLHSPIGINARKKLTELDPNHVALKLAVAYLEQKRRLQKLRDSTNVSAEDLTYLEFASHAAPYPAVRVPFTWGSGSNLLEDPFDPLALLKKRERILNEKKAPLVSPRAQDRKSPGDAGKG
jgi:hypothetical protein